MGHALLIGIDAGTTVLKVCAFDRATGSVVAEASARLEIKTFQGGGFEQSPPLLLRRLAKCLAELRKQTGDRWRAVEGMGLASQAGSTILVKRDTGAPRTSMILWNDTRAMGYAERLQEMQPPSFWQQHTLRVFAPAGLARLLWLRETRPELFTPEIIHAGAGEFLYFHLTGVWRQDTGHAIQVTGYNGIEQQVPAALLELADLPPSLFAPIRDGHTTVPLSKAAAERYGLPEGIPVAGPYFDQEAGYLAAAGEGRKPLQCSLGTAWVGNFTLPIGNWTGSPFQLAVSAPGGEGLLIVQPLLTGNAGWDWALREFIGSSSGQALARAAAFFQERLLPLEGLVAIPWFTQPNPLLPDRVGGGVYIGMNTRTDRSDLLRAVAAGMTFELRRVLGQIADSGHLDCLVLSGGAAKGWYFAQLIAALFAPLPVFCEERAGSATAQGALYAFGPDAVKTPLQRVETAEPAAIHAIKRACNDYVSVFERLYGGQFQGRPFAL